MTPSTATQPDVDLRPLHVNIPEETLVDLRRRIAATRWPEKETVADDTQGVQLATIQKLARYWATEHDWRKVEARINSYPNVAYFNEVDKGGHFAAWEEPALFSEEMRAAFRSLR